MDDDSDRELVDRIITGGDEQAFRLLYRRHTPRLQRLARVIASGRGLEADDLVQDTWIRAVARLSTFEWRSSLLTWLTGILVNRTREVHRREMLAEFSELTEAIGPWPAAPDPVDRIELEQAIQALPPGARTVLVLHDVEGYTHEEIALMLDLSAGTSKSQLCRARRAAVRLLTSESRTTNART